jgi:sulfite reductase (ferredoxin)
MSIQFTPNVSALAQKDILELSDKISVFAQGDTSDESFRKYRLARGVYGQRQPGVQMIRIKLPFGRITADQLIKIADCSDKYATGNLHATTRQDIQLHFVKLADSPQLWSDLEDAGITLREACGNTVRNVTASARAGIDPEELFDVSPHAQAIFEYFLRNPICQEMGRKFKIALSSSEKDSAYAYIHDIGLIPVVMSNSQKDIQHSSFNIHHSKRGFKVFVGGGLGAQPFGAQVAFEFLHEEQVIPFIEATIRVFDRYGERTKRHKARLKYLLNDVGLEGFLKLVEEERKAVKSDELVVMSYEFENYKSQMQESPTTNYKLQTTQLNNWLSTNVFEQKQKGWYAVQLRVLLGDMHSDTARALAQIVKDHAADDIRVTVNQGYLLRFIKPEDLPIVYEKLNALGLAEPGFDSTADITTCPGTDTCNLAISSSYGITRALEVMMKTEFQDLIHNTTLKIKISGCMNGCGQHTAANIGFHGSSLKNGALVLPALQVLLGGGFNSKNVGEMGEKIIKIPAKRGVDGLRILLNDYETNAFEDEYYNDYFGRQGKNYFYQLLKPLADLTTLQQDDYIDWDANEKYAIAIGVGECAGVLIDLVATTLEEANEKLERALATVTENPVDAIYHAYNVFITGAKAMLLSKGVQTNTQYGIINDFDSHFIGEYHVAEGDFKAQVLAINKNEPTAEFAKKFVTAAEQFLTKTQSIRALQLVDGGVNLQELIAAQDS